MTDIASPAGVAAAFRTPHREPDASRNTQRAGRRRFTVGGRVLRALAIVVLSVIAATIGHRFLTRPIAVQTAQVQQGTLREETFGPGTVQSRFSVSIGIRVAGTIDRVLVDVGDEVKAGHLLATLDRTELAARLRASQRAAGSARQEVALARANLDKARSDLALARSNHARARNLVAEGVMAVADFDQSEATVASGEATERSARVAIDARQASVARLIEEQGVAETILSYTELKSPMAGVITRRALEPGSAVTPGAVVFQVVDPKALWVATWIDQSLAGRIAVGQRAAIRLRSGAELAGHVARIAFEADPVTREMEVDVAFDVRPARFAIHEEADVSIFGIEAQGMSIPLAAVVRERGAASVYVIEGERARKRQVQLGLLGAKRAQVIDGLREGDSVVLAPNTVRDGQRVTGAGAS